MEDESESSAADATAAPAAGPNLRALSQAAALGGGRRRAGVARAAFRGAVAYVRGRFTGGSRPTLRPTRKFKHFINRVLASYFLSSCCRCLVTSNGNHTITQTCPAQRANPMPSVTASSKSSRPYQTLSQAHTGNLRRPRDQVVARAQLGLRQQSYWRP